MFPCVLASLAVAALILANAAPLQAQQIRPFTVRFTTNDRGAILLTGNSVMSCPDAVATCAASRARTPGSPLNNNSYNMAFVDVDSDGATLNSSDATLTLPAAATSLWAGLYWFGRNDASAPAALARNRVLLAAPGASGYQTIDASQIDALEPGAYQSFADITAIVVAQGSGAYRVANVRAGPNQIDSSAGWGLVVVYRDPAASFRNLTVFDGAALVTSANPSVTATVTGILTPLAGPVSGEIGAIGWEGDTGTTVFVRDAFRVNGTAQSDAVNAANDFFNSTIARFGTPIAARAPADPNTFGVDIDTVQAAGLANGLTELTLQFTTSGDRYASHVITSAVDIFLPSLDSFAKTVVDVNGGALQPGDLLEYTMTATNTGADAAAAIVLRDPIPPHTTYEPNTLEIVSSPGGIAGTKTDAAGDDHAEFDGAGTRVVFRVGQGASGTTGGSLQPGESFTVRFRVRIDLAVPAGATILNTSELAYKAATTGTAFAGSSGAEVFLPTQLVPNLVITKSDDDQTFEPGGTGTYRITVRNLGGAVSNGVVTMTDTPSVGLTVTTLTGIGWTCDVAARTCTRSDTLGIGASYPVILAGVTVEATAPSSVTNTAAVSGGGEIFTGDNEDAEPTPVGSAGPAIDGTIRDGDGDPIPDATVTLTGPTSATTTTDDQGRFEFTSLQDDVEYTLSVSSPDHTFVPPSRVVTTDEDSVTDFVGAPFTPPFRRYFSESATGTFFDTTFTLVNLSSDAAAATLRIETFDGQQLTFPVSLAAQQQVVVDAESIPGLEATVFATVIEADRPLAVSRTMGWDPSSYGTHVGLGLPAPRTSWYLAEGSTGVFDLFYLLHNPGDQAAAVEITFFRPAPAPPVVRQIAIPPHTRWTIRVNDDPELSATEVAARIVSTNAVPIVVERSQYLGLAGRVWEAGVTGPGIAEPSLRWQFAEGTTGPFFDAFALLLNPQAEPAQIAIRFRFEDGAMLEKTYTLEPQSRRTIQIDFEAPELESTSFAMEIVSTNGVPIVAERAMWWPSGVWYSGHLSAGIPAGVLAWVVPDLTAQPDGDLYLLLANDGSGIPRAEVRLVFQSGAPTRSAIVDLVPNARTTLRLRDLFASLPEGERFAVFVQSIGDIPVPLVVEFETYRTVGDRIWSIGDGGLAWPLH